MGTELEALATVHGLHHRREHHALAAEVGGDVQGPRRALEGFEEQASVAVLQDDAHELVPHGDRLAQELRDARPADDDRVPTNIVERTVAVEIDELHADPRDLSDERATGGPGPAGALVLEPDGIAEVSTVQSLAREHHSCVAYLGVGVLATVELAIHLTVPVRVHREALAAGLHEEAVSARVGHGNRAGHLLEWIRGELDLPRSVRLHVEQGELTRRGGSEEGCQQEADRHGDLLVKVRRRFQAPSMNLALA